MRALIPLLLLSIGCASVLRSSNHDVTIYGPEDLRAFDGARPLGLKREGMEAGHVKYTALVDRHTTSLTLQSQSTQTEVPLTDHVSTGWVILDLLLFWPVTIPVDAISGSWKSFDDITAVSFGNASRPAVAAPQVGTAEDDRRREEERRRSAPPLVRHAVLSNGKLAVLDFKNSSKDLQADAVRYFTDVVRGASLKAAPDLEVMTRENLITLLQATGKDLGQCEGECEVDTGRRIGADAIISGEVLKVGSRYHISLKLHETHDGRLLSTGVATGKTVDELDETLQTAASDLFAPAR